MRKGKLFEFVCVEFEKLVSEIQKGWKTNVWDLDSGQKVADSTFQTMRDPATGGNFLSYPQNLCKGELFKPV